MEYFLDNVLIPSLQAGYTEKYTWLKKVLEGSDDPLMKKVAMEI